MQYEQSIGHGDNFQRGIFAGDVQDWKDGQDTPLPAANCPQIYPGDRFDERHPERAWAYEVQLFEIRKTTWGQGRAFLREGERPIPHRVRGTCQGRGNNRHDMQHNRIVKPL